jgi:hypothetical protein
MTNPDFLRGPWTAVLSSGGDILPSIADVTSDDETFDICFTRGSATPIEEDGVLDWSRGYSGDDVIDLWEDIEPEDLERCWVQAQAMAAGLNAAGGTA